MKPAERALALEVTRASASVAEAALARVTPAIVTFRQLRTLYRIARTWHGKPDTEIRQNESGVSKWIACSPTILMVTRDVDRRVWCRSYVRAWLSTRPVVHASADGRAHLVASGDREMCVVVDGVFNPPMTGKGYYVTTPACSPYIAHEIVRVALWNFIGALVKGITPAGWTEEQAYHLAHSARVNPALYGTMRRLFSGLAIGAMKHVLGKVQPDTLAVVRRAGMPRALAWLQSGSREREARLRDALKAYPVPMLWVMRRMECHAYALLGAPKKRGKPLPEDVCERAIADGGSVVDAIARMFGTTSGAVRLWHGVTRQRALPAGIMHAWPHEDRLPEIARLMAALPVHLRPRTRKAFGAMFAFARYDIVGTAMKHDPSVLTRWLAPYASLCDPMLEHGWGLGDMVTSLVDSVEDAMLANPATLREAPRAGDVMAVVFRKRWQSLCDLSARWHAAQVEATVRGSQSAAREQWPGVMRSPFAHDGIEIVELTSGEALIEEGAAMRHCVSAFVPYCLAGQSRILSVRRGDTRLSTVELGRVDCDRGFRMRQHYSEENLPVDESAAAAVRAWLDMVDLRVGQNTADDVINRDWPKLAVHRTAKVDMRWFWAQEPALPASLRRLFAAWT